MSLALSKRDLYIQLAELHVKNINQGFLSTLGVKFVALMYRAIDECHCSAVFVDESEGRVVGFVAGSVGMRPIYARMLRYWPSLLVALLPSVVNPYRVWRIFETLKYSRTHSAHKDLPVAELLSIAVDPMYRGQSRADALYKRLADYFRERGDVMFKITVGNSLDAAHKFYQRMGAVPVAKVEVHKGEMSTIYVDRPRVE